jgi:hypothetical protein
MIGTVRHSLFAAFVLVPSSIFAWAQQDQFATARPAAAQGVNAAALARFCGEHCSPAWMDANLRINEVQVVGTAESYKLRPDKALLAVIRMAGSKKDAEAIDFGQPSLDKQLDKDARSLDFDVAYDPQGGAYKNPAGANLAMDLLPDEYTRAMAKPGFKVIHVLDVDYRSSCLLLSDCLRQISDWSKVHPRHLPIVITLHTNDSKTPMPGATKPVACTQAALDALDREIRSVFAPDQMITPDQVQADHGSLREAALAHAWPLLGEARGKMIFVLNDNGAKAKAYQGKRKSLEGRAMFLAADENSPLAAFLFIPDPVKDGARIRSAVQKGFMVITRADEEAREARADSKSRRDAAFASGAQIVQTDFAVPDPAIGSYRVSLADNSGALCGTGSAPEHCLRILAPIEPVRTATATAVAP